MRLDHLLSKDRFVVRRWSSGCLLSGPCGSGPAGRGCRTGIMTGWCCGRVLWGWLVVVLGVEDTPAAAWLVVVGASVRACVRVGVACCRGSGAVRPGCLTCLGLLVVGGFGWVWVGWL